MLEQTISILEKTNTSLTQQWTPVSVLLSITAGLFAVVTILWAVIFAWGIIIFKKVISNKKKMASEMRKLSNEGKKMLEDIDVKGKTIFAKVEEKSKTIPELEKELNNFKRDVRQTIENFEDKTIGTISGSVNFNDTGFASQRLWADTLQTPNYIGSIVGNSARNNLNVCSRCNSVFVEDASVSSLDSQILFASSLFENEVLCKKCKEKDGDRKNNI